MYPYGKSIFIHKIKDVHNGHEDPVGLANIANSMGFSSVIMKVIDGTTRYNISTTLSGLKDVAKPLVDALWDVGVEPWGWAFLRKDLPEAQADLANQRVQDLGLAGLVLDVESEFEIPTAEDVGRRYLSRLNLNVPVGFCSFRFPDVHQSVPWEDFMAHSDFYMPMVYWQDAHNPAQQLDKCVLLYRQLEQKYGIHYKNIIPIGAAYHENGWQPTIEEIVEFASRANSTPLPGFSFWEWGHAIRYGFESEISKLVANYSETQVDKLERTITEAIDRIVGLETYSLVMTERVKDLEAKLQARVDDQGKVIDSLDEWARSYPIKE